MKIARSARLLLAVTLAGAAAVASAQDAQPGAASEDAWSDEPIRPIVRGVEPEADRLLRAMSEYIAAAKAFTFTIEVAEDVLLPHGQKISYGGVSNVAVQRPGSLHARFRGEERNSRIVIHDGKCTLHNVAQDIYAVTEVPKTIDDAIDTIVERYGLNIPVADIAYADPYQAVIGAVQSGLVVGTTSIDGHACHHLAFAQESIDWQVWIDAGPHPLLRKLVITYKDEPGSPHYTARLRDWNLAPHLSAHYFDFTPPASAEQVEFLPADRATDTEEDS